MAGVKEASLTLVGNTKLSLEEMKAAAKKAVEAANRGGPSASGLLIGGGVLSVGKVRVAQERGDGMSFAIDALRGHVENATFDLEMEKSEGRMEFGVVLQTYRVQQSKALGMIPVTPKQISGFHTYTAFLSALEGEVRSRDSGAKVYQENA